jgi:hypothetical protein
VLLLLLLLPASSSAQAAKRRKNQLQKGAYFSQVQNRTIKIYGLPKIW